MSAPLNRHLKAESSDKIGELDHKQTQYPNKMIKSVTSPPVLSLPNNGLPYGMDTDASTN